MKRKLLLLIIFTASISIFFTCKQPAQLTVTMVEPVEAGFTNGSIVLRGEVTGGTPSSFEFLKGEEVLASLDESFEYEWNTLGTDEGSYEITARTTIDDTAYTSEPVTVTVDRTAPAVSTTTPADGSANVSSGAEITVTFSEAVDEESLTSESARLLNGTGGTIGTARNLSDDGTALTLNVLGSPAVPNTLTGSLSTGITDLAGNKLDAPADWSWEVPAWQQLGGGISIEADNDTSDPTIAFNSEGAPYIAFRELGTTSIIYVVSWDGTSWNQVGSAVSNTSIGSYWPSLEIDSADRPVVVYEKGDTVIVKRYDNGSWTQMGAELNIDTSETAILPDLAVNPQDQPIVTWNEDDSGAGYSKVYVKKWNGVSFIQLGSELNVSTEEAFSSHLAVASDGTPYISWIEYYFSGGYFAAYVSEWTGSSWDRLEAAPLNTTSYNVTEPIIKMNPQDDPVVIYEQATSSGADDIVLQHYTDQWNVVDIMDVEPENDADEADVAVDSMGRIVSIWREESTRIKIYVKRGKQSFSLLGDSLNVSISGVPDDETVVEIGPGDVPYAAWAEDIDDKKIYVKRYNEF
jgi:hypothetical protein